MAHIRQLPLGPMQTNCYILVCEDTKKTAVIDPSWDGNVISNFLSEEGFELDSILLTHAHFDHVGGLGDLKDAHPEIDIYAHPDSAPLLKQAEGQARMFGMEFPPAPPADKELAEGDKLTVGNLELDVLYTPGHAPGHVSFLLESHGVIFSGDVLFQGSIGRTDLPGANHAELMSIIETKLMPLPDETQVLSGHGPVTTIGRERQANPFLQ